MAKGQHLSRHQKGIVKRYYEHQDTIVAATLAEVVSDLYLADSEKKQASLWKRAKTALAKSGEKPEEAARIVEQRDLEALAKVAGRLAGGSGAKPKRG